MRERPGIVHDTEGDDDALTRVAHDELHRTAALAADIAGSPPDRDEGPIAGDPPHLTAVAHAR